MANHVRYIRRRDNGIYYYERRVPQAVVERSAEWTLHFGGMPLFRQSLRTRSQSGALSAGKHADERFEKLVTAALGLQPALHDDKDNATRAVTALAVERISAETRERVVRPWAQLVVRAELGEEDHEELDRRVYERELDAQQLREILFERKPSADPRLPDLADDVDFIIRTERFDAPPGSTARAVLMRAVRDGHLAGQKEIDAILAGQAPAIPKDRLSRRPARAPKLSEAMKTYIGQLRAKRTIREAQGAVASFIDAVGDLPLDEITRAEMLAYCRAEGAKTIGGKTSGSIVRPISASTLKKKIGLLRSAINHAIATDSFAGPNPAAQIDARRFTKPVPKEKMPDKRPFTVHELQLIVQHPWFTGCMTAANTHAYGAHRLDGMHFWVPILAMFTGCRAGEIGGLRVVEVRLDHQHPHLVIQDNKYRTTKGSYRRNVPILDTLMHLGFDKFVERVAHKGHDRLFHDWKAPAGVVDAGATAWSNGSLIRSFNRTLVPQQLGSLLMDGARQEVTFHSFRGAFKTLLGRSEYAIPENYKHEIIGHAKSALDKRYIQEIPLADTYPAVRGCTYKDLVLPEAP